MSSQCNSTRCKPSYQRNTGSSLNNSGRSISCVPCNTAGCQPCHRNSITPTQRNTASHQVFHQRNTQRSLRSLEQHRLSVLEAIQYSVVYYIYCNTRGSQPCQQCKTTSVLIHATLRAINVAQQRNTTSGLLYATPLHNTTVNNATHTVHSVPCNETQVSNTQRQLGSLPCYCVSSGPCRVPHCQPS